MNHPPHRPYAVLAVPAFRWYALNLLLATLGIQIQGVVVSWQVYEITKDPLALGAIGLAEVIPFIGAALFAGHVADTASRKLVVFWAQACLLLCGVALIVLSLFPSMPHPVLLLYGIVAVGGLARSFLMPARTALIAELLPPELYAGAVRWRGALFQTASVIGPAIGGLLWAFGGAKVACSVVALLLGGALACLAGIPGTPATPPAKVESIWISLTGGISFMFSEPLLLGAATLDMFAVLFGGAVALLPIFSAEILHAGPQGLGILRAAPAAGAVAMSLLLAHRPPFRRAGLALFSAVIIFGLCMIGFGLSTSFLLSFAFLAVSGAADEVSVVVRQTILQLRTPRQLLGRVAAVNSIFIGSSNEIGAFESGLAARWLGTVVSVVAGGVATLVVTGAAAWRFPVLRKLGSIEPR
jgi:MFS family permease